MSQGTVRTLETLCRVGRPTILGHGISVDSCIASTRIGVEALRRIGIAAGPTAVKVAAFNKEGHRAMVAGHPEWVREQRDGAYGIGIGYPTDGPGWDGHLVITVERKWLLDLSIDQASRPEHGIVLKPFFTRRAFTSKGVMLLRIPDGGALRYELDPDNKAYKHAPDWRLTKWGPIVKEIVAAIRGGET